jgi:hypothetical protein
VLIGVKDERWNARVWAYAPGATTGTVILDKLDSRGAPTVAVQSDGTMVIGVKDGQWNTRVWAGPAAQAQPAMQTVSVTVPQGMQGGMQLQVQLAAHLVQVTIPDGLGPGMSFNILAPPVDRESV